MLRSPSAWLWSLWLLACLLLPGAVGAQEAPRWVQTGPDGAPRVQLWFFWSRQCPHCQEARPLVEGLPVRFPWLELHSLELSEFAEHRQLYTEMAALFRQEPRSVPAFFYCGTMRVGYDTAAGTGTQLLDELSACHRRAARGEVIGATPAVALPGVEGMEETSLPFLTLAIAGLDAFNPCAFFVLLFLLGMLVHARSRRRMLLVGGVFVFFSGLLYFLFMAAWLNLFLLLGELRWITAGAALVALAMAGLNLKDYVRPGVGPSLSISERAKPGLFRRVRGLLQAQRLGPLLLGTVVLALLANSYELLCTSGLPMVYTRILTLRDLPSAGYYGYLVLYNVIYVLPLLAIVLLFTWLLGAHKLQAYEGRLLKLLSGLMMLGLGLVLLLAPTLLHDIATTGGIVAGAAAVTLLAWLVERRREAAR